MAFNITWIFQGILLSLLMLLWILDNIWRMIVFYWKYLKRLKFEVIFFRVRRGSPLDFRSWCVFYAFASKRIIKGFWNIIITKREKINGIRFVWSILFGWFLIQQFINRNCILIFAFHLEILRISKRLMKMQGKIWRRWCLSCFPLCDGKTFRIMEKSENNYIPRIRVQEAVAQRCSVYFWLCS